MGHLGLAPIFLVFSIAAIAEVTSGQAPLLSPPASYNVGANPQSVAMGDFNGDSRLDLAVANFDADTMSVLVNQGGGGFGAPTNYATGFGPIAVAAGDLSNDGKTDLAVANFYTQGISVFLGQGGAIF